MPLCPSPQAPFQVPTMLASPKQVWVEASSELVLPAGGRGQHQHRHCPQFPRLLWPPVSERSGLSGILLTSTMLSESLDRRPQPRHGDGVRWGTAPGALTRMSTLPSSGGVDHNQCEGRHHGNPGVHLQHRPNGHGRPGLRPGGLANAPAGQVGDFLCHLPDILVSMVWGLFPWGETERDPRRCPSPLPLWLATAPKMLRPWKRVM